MYLQWSEWCRMVEGWGKGYGKLYGLLYKEVSEIGC